MVGWVFGECGAMLSTPMTNDKAVVSQPICSMLDGYTQRIAMKKSRKRDDLIVSRMDPQTPLIDRVEERQHKGLSYTNTVFYCSKLFMKCPDSGHEVRQRGEHEGRLRFLR